MFCVGVLLFPAQALGRNPRMARIRACTAASPAAKQICTSGSSSKSKRMSSVKGKAGPSVTNKSNIHCILSFQALHKSIFGVPFRVFMCFLFTSDIFESFRCRDVSGNFSMSFRRKKSALRLWGRPSSDIWMRKGRGVRLWPPRGPGRPKNSQNRPQTRSTHLENLMIFLVMIPLG